MEQEPIYIKIEDFDEVSKILDDIRKKTVKVKAKLNELRETKEKEEKSLMDWEQRISRLVAKVDQVEGSLSTSKGG